MPAAPFVAYAAALEGIADSTIELEGSARAVMLTSAYSPDVAHSTYADVSPFHTPARELLRRGHLPDALLHVQHAGRAFDPTIVPKPIGEIAKWQILERDRDGTCRARWHPEPDDPLATMYPHLWIEPSQWPWDSPPSTRLGSRTRSDLVEATGVPHEL
jgi:hypothetical protein